MKKIIALLFGALLLAGCGDPDVDITESTYTPKIVVEAFIYGGESVEGIKLTRNFRLGADIDSTKMFLTPAANGVTASINGTQLLFDETSSTYYNPNIVPGFGGTYRLEVSAQVEGKDLTVTSETTIPMQGFEVPVSDLGTITYREQQILIPYTTSPGAEVYAFSIRPSAPSLDNFIYDNPYEPNPDRDDLADHLNDYIFQYRLLINVKPNPDDVNLYLISGYDTWFYDKYKTVVYAGDKNFKDYILTADYVQEMDGNFLEPKFHLNGEGIGVFAGAIRDTVTFELARRN